MSNPSQLLPLKFGELEITRIRWSQFKGQVNQSMPWSAHVFWWIDYHITDYNNKKVKVKVNISPKSWVNPQKKCAHLLNHEQGHYLIGSLCALEFMRRVDSKANTATQKFQDLVNQTFDRTIKQYLQLQKKYDSQTNHRLNYEKQNQWDKFIYDKLVYYTKIYNGIDGKFMKLCDSPLIKHKKQSIKSKG